MRFALEDYQKAAVDDLLKALHRARTEYLEDDTRTAVGLTAPTGAGKTVIATALLEALFLGTDGRPAQPDLTVLWLTDDQSLNRQTIDKILQASGGRIDATRIRFLADTDERTLEPGFIYFVHIQALQRNSTLHVLRSDGSRSDRRTFGAWEMIANTARERGADLLVVWDEAHRGAGSTDTDRRTIAGTIVNGGITNIGTQQPPVPVVLGISATPDRWRSAMGAVGRMERLVAVPAGDVRQSGLLKDRILIKHVGEDQGADNTMLALAVADLRASSEAWRRHRELTGDRLVEPLLVVQVEPAVSATRIGEILETIESAWPEITDYAVGHAFGDPHGPLTVGRRTVRYIPPEAIAADDRARVVLFKSALTTGWDCPRAEVLVSFQGKESFTEIAQLIGRLVRTPLAQRVEGDDRLNEVVAYLPGFKMEHVTRVVRSLTEDETVETEVLIEPINCGRNPDVSRELFEVLDTLPSYERPRASFASRTAQLIRLAAALGELDLVANAPRKARRWIVDQMRAAAAKREDEIEARVADYRSLRVDTTVVGIGSTITADTTSIATATAERDLDAYFLLAQRVLPDGSADWYAAYLCDEGMDDVLAGVQVAAMATLGFREVVEQQALALIDEWRDTHASAVSKMPRQQREVVTTLWYTGDHPMVPTTVVARDYYPAATERVVRDATVPVKAYPLHLYCAPPDDDGIGRFPVDTSRSSWEAIVLCSEIDENETMVGWYRNPSSGKHALAVPYEFGGRTQLMHPDFLFFHDDGDGRIVIDIVDPHRHDESDTSAKWSALARYAAEHADLFRRVVAVIRDKHGDMRALDLTRDGMAERIGAAGDKDLVEDLFAREGMAY